MAEYISREAAIDTVLDVYYDIPDIDLSGEKLEAAILNIQAADVEPVKHGRWIEYKHFHHNHYIDSTYECSECKVEEPLTSDYCPNCGAKMDCECDA